MEKLGILQSNALVLFTQAKDKGSRTEVLTQQLEEAFDALETFMREMRIMYFHNPPLTNADLVSLRLPVKNGRPGRLGKPTATVAARAVPTGGSYF